MHGADRRIAEGQSAGWAWQETIEAQARVLAKLDDPLLAGRATDLRDVGQRVLRRLAGAMEERPGAARRARHPARRRPDALGHRRARPGAASSASARPAAGRPRTRRSSPARSASPPWSASGPAVLHQPEGATAVLDGDAGGLYIDPSAEDLRSAARAGPELARRPARRRDPHALPAGAHHRRPPRRGRRQHRPGAGGGAGRRGRRRGHRPDAHRVPVPRPRRAALRGRAVRRPTPRWSRPSSGLPLIVRTLDIGGDKDVPYLELAARGQPVPRRARHPPLPRAARALRDPAARDLPRLGARTDQDHVPDDRHARRTCARARAITEQVRQEAGRRTGSRSAS